MNLKIEYELPRPIQLLLKVDNFKMKILVTGATGFIGRALCPSLAAIGHEVVPSAHRLGDVAYDHNIDTKQPWNTMLDGVDSVVHLAARVHINNFKSTDPLSDYRLINVEGTLSLARISVAAGVKRFIYLSSVKVNGESTLIGSPFTADNRPSPQDPYGISKLEAEEGLRQIAMETSMEVVIIRPPLVYGPGVKANFASMMLWLKCGLPLPLAAITYNRRSLVALDNLIDLIVTCLLHPAAANQTFLVSDGEDLSTVDLLQRMGIALGHPAKLFYLPPKLLRWGAILQKRSGIYQRLFGSLQVDISKTRQLLGWSPPISVDEGLRLAAKTASR